MRSNPSRSPDEAADVASLQRRLGTAADPLPDDRVGLMRVLAVADQVADALWGDALTSLQPDIVLACGDLPFEYLENLVSRLDRPLLYVPGNHDPDLRPPDPTWRPPSFLAADLGPAGCDNVDGRVLQAGGLTIAGLGGSVRYRPGGPNQYTQAEMSRRALRLELRARLGQTLRGRRLDVIVSHAPPLGYGDAPDPVHVGFAALTRLVGRLSPRVLVHGHVHRYGSRTRDLRLGRTLIVNAIPYRLLEL